MNIILCEGEDVREQTNFRIHFSRYAGHASSIYFCEGVRVSEGSRAAVIKREECCLTKKDYIKDLRDDKSIDKSQQSLRKLGTGMPNQ